jgi:hypothetical protein
MMYLLGIHKQTTDSGQMYISGTDTEYRYISGTQQTLQTSARMYRPCIRQNKPKTLVF